MVIGQQDCIKYRVFECYLGLVWLWAQTGGRQRRASRLELVGMKTCTATLKISMLVSQENGNQSILRSNNSTLRHILK